MDDTTLLIKKMPADLKHWLASEAARNDRSMNKEAIRLLEEARKQRESTTKSSRNRVVIQEILKSMQALPVLDQRPLDDILYDEAGMPK